MQNGFRYTLSSTSVQEIVFANRPAASGNFYDLSPTASVLLGGDNHGYSSCLCDLQDARVYVDYYPDSADEYINLAVMNTGKIKLKFGFTKLF